MEGIRTGWVGVALAVTLAIGTANAQVPFPLPVPTETETPTEPEPSLEGWQQLFQHSEEISRAAFESVDANSDDRLSIFEATKSIYGLGTIRDGSAFRATDTSADGYLQWPEFDVRFRELSSRGSPLTIKPERPLILPETESPEDVAGTQATDQLFEILDTDRDGTVTIEEIDGVASELGVADSIVKLLRNLDTDGSGTVSAQEMGPVARLFPATPTAKSPDDETALPRAYATADANGDGAVDAVELRTVLGRVDPRLTQWSEQIVKDADRSKNGSLGPLEIRQARPAGAEPAKPAKPKPRPATGGKKKGPRGLRGS